MAKRASATNQPYIGGQAVIEGVMMRAPEGIAIVCRRRDGSLVVRERPTVPRTGGPRTWPLVRGIAAVGESLRLGSRALRWSAALYDRDALGHGAPATSLLTSLSGAVLSLVTRPDDGDEGAPMADPIDEPRAGGAPVVPILFALTLFMALPQGLAELINYVLGLGLPVTSPLYQAITGAAQMGVLLGYLLLLRRIPEVRRVFQYHGAEHKAVSTYEAGDPLELVYARPRTTLHARCGTTFLVMVALVSVVAFSVAGALFPPLYEGRLVESIAFFLLKLPLLPAVAAVTFELQRLFARLDPKGPLGFVLWPGFAVQRITTAEPDDRALEVALAALRATLWRREVPGAPPAPDRIFSSFQALTAYPGYDSREGRG